METIEFIETPKSGSMGNDVVDQGWCENDQKSYKEDIGDLWKAGFYCCGKKPKKENVGKKKKKKCVSEFRKEERGRMVAKVSEPALNEEACKYECQKGPYPERKGSWRGFKGVDEFGDQHV